MAATSAAASLISALAVGYIVIRLLLALPFDSARFALVGRYVLLVF